MSLIVLESDDHRAEEHFCLTTSSGFAHFGIFSANYLVPPRSQAHPSCYFGKSTSIRILWKILLYRSYLVSSTVVRLSGHVKYLVWMLYSPAPKNPPCPFAAALWALLIFLPWTWLTALFVSLDFLFLPLFLTYDWKARLGPSLFHIHFVQQKNTLYQLSLHRDVMSSMVHLRFLVHVHVHTSHYFSADFGPFHVFQGLPEQFSIHSSPFSCLHISWRNNLQGNSKHRGFRTLLMPCGAYAPLKWNCLARKLIINEEKRNIVLEQRSWSQH